jgi:conjugal transfer pilus assembly protein TraU
LRRIKLTTFLCTLIIALSAAFVEESVLAADTGCKGTPLNPVTDVCWRCIFPVKIGGRVSVGGGGQQELAEANENPFCACGGAGSFTAGVRVSFWEPARMVETVKNAYCFPGLGAGLPNPAPGTLNGSQGTQAAGGENSHFAQAHYYIFPVWSMLELFADFPCLEEAGFDLAYMTEIDPMWNSDVLSFFINPEAILFGNPIAQLACLPDSIAASAGYPLDPLFWCMGSWGSAYPLSGSSTMVNPTAANAGLAARMIYKLGRELLLFDPSVDVCGAVPTPVWVKSHYRLQIARPVRGDGYIPIGRSDLLWGGGKNPVAGTGNNSPDNFLWMIFRRTSCCVGYSP